MQDNQRQQYSKSAAGLLNKVKKPEVLLEFVCETMWGLTLLRADGREFDIVENYEYLRMIILNIVLPWSKTPRKTEKITEWLLFWDGGYSAEEHLQFMGIAREANMRALIEMDAANKESYQTSVSYFDILCSAISQQKQAA